MFQLLVETAGMNSKTGDLIKDALKKKGMTQSDLAERMGVSNTAVHKWIKKGGVSRENMAGLFANLDIPIEDLVLPGSASAELDHLMDPAHRTKNRAAIAHRLAPDPILEALAIIEAAEPEEAALLRAQIIAKAARIKRATEGPPPGKAGQSAA